MKEELNFEDLLPSEPTKKEKAEMKKRYLTDDAIVYRAKNYRDPLTDISVRACECVCSACGETFYLERVCDPIRCDHRVSDVGVMTPDGKSVFTGEKAECPQCGKEVLYLHTSSVSNSGYYLRSAHPVTFRMIDGNMAIVMWYCGRYVTKAGRAFDEIRRYEAYVFSKKRGYRLCAYEHGMFGSVRLTDLWTQKKKAADELGGLYGKDIIIPNGDMLKGTYFENCRLFKYLRETERAFPVTYMKVWMKHKNIEGLTETGAAQLLSSFFEMTASPVSYSYNNTDFRYSSNVVGIDWKQKKPSKMLGLTRPEYAKVLEKVYDAKTLMMYQRLKRYGLTLDDVDKIGYYENAYEECARKGSSIPQIMNYINKQKNIRATVEYLRDYYRLCDTLGIPVDKDTRFPKDLVREHDRLTAEINRRKAEIEKEKEAKRDALIRRRSEGLSALAFTDGVLMIRPVADLGELKDEGKQLHHCVASYAEKVASGKTDIFFIRKVKSPDKPFFTLELNEESVRVVQNRGKGNCDRTPEVEAFEEKWLEFVKLNIKKIRNRKVTVNG